MRKVSSGDKSPKKSVRFSERHDVPEVPAAPRKRKSFAQKVKEALGKFFGRGRSK